ncbi:MAG: phosphoenolpyruvate synthase [Ardenticatenales bacterium]|nr:phosphoenolpyruvate synthase [Ardenticatenales bacterium]
MSAPSVTAIPLILPLDSPHASLGAVGGKGASLARLSAAALPVPPGFHVTTTAYRRFIDANHLSEVIRRAAGRASIDDPASLERASALIRALIAQGSMPRDIAEGVGAAYAVLGAGEPAVAVRSSATAEDLPELSFAGQHDSFLNVCGADAVLAAVKRCWASLWTARAIGYRARQGIDGADVNLAVVVQRLVPADVAGILFTANPMSGVRDEVVINAAWGLGEAIVGGHVTPDTFRVDKATGTIRSADVMDKVVQTVRTDGGTREVPLSASLRTAPTLSPAHIAELTRLGSEIEELYGHPVDMEWAIANGSIAVVQARPITALPDPIVELDWTTPNPTGRYARSSVIELLPEPLSPLFETLALPRWNRAMAALMEEIGLARVMKQLTDLTTINGFAYYDYSMSPAQTFRMLFHFLTHPGQLIDHFRQARSVWADRALPRYRAVAAEWAERDLAAASATALLAGAARITDAAAAYYLTIQSGILPVAYIGEACFAYFYDKLAKRKGDPPAIAYLLGYDSKPIRAEKALFDLAQWAHEHPDLAFALTSMSAADLASALDGPTPPGVSDDAWNVFTTLFAAHLQHYGDAVYDLDFSKPLAADDPSPLLEALKSFVAGDARSPHARQAASSAAREAATNALRSRLRGRRGRFVGWLLGGAQQFAPLREDALADVGLGWPQLRRMMHALGERAVAAGAVAASDDVYWLTVDELQDVARAIDSGQRGADHADTVAKRRATAAHNRTATPPVALPLKGGATFLGMDLMRFMPAHSHQDGGDTIKGIGASPGRVTGTARVILGPEHFHAMRHGDILVTKITTPAWTPLFALAAGIVTDVGGPLSHSSIVAREYGIPAVLGTGVATARVKDGGRITVDGDEGRVMLER